jgi:hypothetical protein
VSLAIERLAANSLIDRKSNIVSWAIIAYIFLAAVGRTTVCVSRDVAGIDFGPAWDDSYFFYRALDIASGTIPDRVSPFDLLGGAVAAISNFLQGDTRLLDLIPLVWTLGALSVALATAIAEHISQRAAPTVATVSILGNAVFIDTCTHYYRDALILVFLGFSLLFSLRRHWIFGIGAALLAASIRLANGAIALLGVFLLAFSQSGFGHRRPRLTGIICVVVCALAGVVGSVANREGDSLSGVAGSRRQALREFYQDSSDQSLTTKLYYAGPPGVAIAGVAAVFAPITFRRAVQNILYVSVDETKIGRGLFLFSVLEWLTIVLWPMVGPPLVVGCRSAFKGTSSQRVLLAVFVVTILGNILVSLQPRHRCSFIILFPMLVALANPKTQARLLRALACAFVVLIASLNILQALYLH